MPGLRRTAAASWSVISWRAILAQRGFALRLNPSGWRRYLSIMPGGRGRLLGGGPYGRDPAPWTSDDRRQGTT